MSPGARFALAAAGAIAIGALLFHPLASARPYADDFLFITVARQLEEPWRLLVQDSLGIYFFRPLGMFFWWATVRLFGDGALHYLANIGLHLATAAALYGLVRTFRASAPIAGLVAIAFAVHPTTFSAAAWLSDRFDLLAAPFGLLALIAVQRFLERPVLAWAVLAGGATFASLLSKEVGFVFPGVALLLLLLRDSGPSPAGTRSRLALGAAIAAVAGLALAIRFAVLRGNADTMFYGGGLARMVIEGTLKWARLLPDFVVAEAGSLPGIAAWLGALLALAVAGLVAVRRAAFDRELAIAIAAGVAMMLLSAAAQSPITRASRILPYTLDGIPQGSVMFDWLVSNRYYYVSMAGFFLVFGAIAEGVRRNVRTRVAATLGWSLAALAMVGLLSGARAVGRDWSRFTRTQDAALIAAAAEAFGGAHRWPEGCKIFLLGTRAYSANFLYQADTIVKSMMPPGHSLMGCLVQTEVAPWLHVADRGRMRSVAPLETITHRGKPYPPLEVGNLAIFYLRIPDSDAVRQDADSRFFEFDGARFVEVTAAVREGRRAVRFYDNRPPG